jgi:hypothetical protein
LASGPGTVLSNWLASSTENLHIGLTSGELFVWPPTQLDESLKAQIDALGPVRHLISLNKLHYANVEQWKHAYPQATSWASPGVRERAVSQGIEVSFEIDLGEDCGRRGPPPQEASCHGKRVDPDPRIKPPPASRTVILADLIENFEPEKLGRFYGWLVRLAGAAHRDGKTPLDLRATFLGNKDEARVSLEKMLSWEPEQVIMAHGLPYSSVNAQRMGRVCVASFGPLRF